jgi:integrase
MEHRFATDGHGLVFGEQGRPFHAATAQGRADRAWARAGLQRVTLHQCRHFFATLMVTAGVNAKELSVYMGHSAVSTTLDVYADLFRGSEQQAAKRLDAYLAAEAEQRARAAEA